MCLVFEENKKVVQKTHILTGMIGGRLSGTLVLRSTTQVVRPEAMSNAQT